MFYVTYEKRSITIFLISPRHCGGRGYLTFIENRRARIPCPILTEDHSLFYSPNITRTIPTTIIAIPIAKKRSVLLSPRYLIIESSSGAISRIGFLKIRKWLSGRRSAKPKTLISEPGSIYITKLIKRDG